jgi:peptidyl-prolyl cis-trans isomerase A (cyclophilin A)
MMAHSRPTSKPADARPSAARAPPRAGEHFPMARNPESCDRGGMRSVLTSLAAASVVLAATSALAFPQSTHPAMTDPSKATEKAPDTFRAKFETTKGDFAVECTRSWAPNGVDRFYNLVKIGFFDDIAFFRVAKGFVVQWGIHGDPKVSSAWQSANLPPDPPTQSNTRGMLTYAMAGRPDTRSTQLFINFKDNTGLDAQGFAPICKVAEGMDVVDALNGEYGERITQKQGEIHDKGNAYLRETWPNLDYVKKATITSTGGGGGGGGGSTSSAKPEEGGTSPIPFVIGGAAFLGLLAYMMRKPKPEEPAKKEPEAKATKKPSRPRDDDDDSSSKDGDDDGKSGDESRPKKAKKAKKKPS